MKIRITAFAIVTAIGGAALAHEGASGVVLERMEGMKAMGGAVRTVAPIMRGEAEYDAEAMRETARIIEMHSGEAMTELFPEGTNDAPSETKDAVWTDWEEFAALAERLEIAAQGLALAADNGLAATDGAMSSDSMMGGSASGMMDGASMMGGSGGMMGGGMMGSMSAEDIGRMPVDAAFAMTTQVCSACHTRFRAEDD